MKPDRNEPKLVDARTVTMPCPVCGHPQNDSRWQEAAYGKSAKSEPKEGPTSVPCLLCGAAIRVVVPFHVLCAMPAGWRWERTIDERARVKEYVHARLVDLVNAGASNDRVAAIGPTQAFFKALNAMTVAEVEEVFQHPLVLTCWGSEHGNGIQLAYAKYRRDSEVKNE